jgi:PilZ domain
VIGEGRPAHAQPPRTSWSCINAALKGARCADPAVRAQFQAWRDAAKLEAMTDTSRVIRSAARKLAAWKDQEQVCGEQRRQPRQPVHIAAKINVGSLRECLVLDISSSGARVAVKAPKDIPDRIAICMTKRGFPTHLCRVIWRSDCEIGVEFEVAAQA